jgi:ribosomal protein S27AE
MDEWDAQELRRFCSECGSGHLHWMPGEELPGRVSLGLMRDAQSLVLNVALYQGEPTAWLCPRCGHFGVFGPVHFDGALH